MTEEDIEVAMLLPWRLGLKQIRRRVLERYKAKVAADRGFPVSDHELIEWFPNMDGDLLVIGCPGDPREQD